MTPEPDSPTGQADSREEVPTPLFAAKAFVLFGKQHERGDPVDVSRLTKEKIRRLLDQRYLQPDL